MYITCEYCKFQHLIEDIEGHKVFWCPKAGRYFKLHHERIELDD